MGSANGHNWEGPVHSVRTQPFQITVSPITNSQYRAFKPGHKSAADGDEMPVTGVSWAEAQEYAAWLSTMTARKFALPTEARWERAVRGGLEQQDYPWGNEPAGNGKSSAFPGEPAKNPFGIRAVGYNLWEWTADWYAADYFSTSPSDDPQGPPEGSFRVLRGGGYRDDPTSATTYTRGSARPDTRSEHITFRLMEITAVDQQVSETPAPAVVSEVRPQPSAPAPAVSSAAPVDATPVQQAQPSPTPAPPAPKPAPKPKQVPVVAATAAAVTSISVEGDASDVTVRVRGTGSLGVKSFTLSGPDRIVVDVAGAQMKTDRKQGEIAVALGGVSKVRYALFQLEPPIIRIVIDAERKLKHQIETRSDGFVVRLGP